MPHKPRSRSKTSMPQVAAQAGAAVASAPASAPVASGKPGGDVLATAPAGASTAGVVASADRAAEAKTGNAALNKAEATAPSHPVMISASGAVTPVQPATATASGGSYTVSKGDTLSAIARKHSVSVSDLRKWNDLKNDNLRVGQTLKLSATP